MKIEPRYHILQATSLAFKEDRWQSCTPASYLLNFSSVLEAEMHSAVAYTLGRLAHITRAHGNGRIARSQMGRRHQCMGAAWHHSVQLEIHAHAGTRTSAKQLGVRDANELCQRGKYGTRVSN